MQVKSCERVCRFHLLNMHLFQICDAVMASGQNQSLRKKIQEQSPLMYEWYQEEYVGAAHGLSGIYYYLMQVSTHNTCIMETTNYNNVKVNQTN